MACFDLKGRFCLASKNLPCRIAQKMLLHLFEEDTLLFLSVGNLWLKAVYQVANFCVWNLPILCLSKIGKISKIIKNPKNIRFAVE